MGGGRDQVGGKRGSILESHVDRALFFYELHVIDIFLSLLLDITFFYDKDKWIWNHTREGNFSVSSTYHVQLVISISFMSSHMVENLNSPLIWVS